MKIVDVCGLSCPEPLLRLKQAIDKSDEIKLITDNKSTADNCSRFAKSKGFLFSESEDNGHYVLTLTT